MTEYYPDDEVQDPEPPEHAWTCCACGEDLTGEVCDGMCPACSEAWGQAEDWQVDTGGGRW